MDVEKRMHRGPGAERRSGGDTVPGALPLPTLPPLRRRRLDDRRATVGEDDVAREWWSIYQSLKDQ